MYGGRNYRVVASGSMSASSNDPHLLISKSLTAVNVNTAVHVQVKGESNNIIVFEGSTAPNGGGGFFVPNADYYIDFPPMTRGRVEDLHIKNAVDGSNGGARYYVWVSDVG